ncbi:hypothetical protein EW146_g8633 [Bondarzewia mesenterica]|uniref:Uncharacterized protein n=1 Tax=Bondarzewia mesenterica TaxID=1095465 RepID=A0A4S4LCX0_9AGAM|nr:hypothetical protein EW146_g8633 [Bondarzewia mesenterica]
MEVIPRVLRSDREGAGEVLTMVGEWGSAKEVVMAAQECVEWLGRVLGGRELEDGVEGEGGEGGEEEEDLGDAARAVKIFVRLLSLYASAIPRLKTRKSSAETLRSVLPDLERLVWLVAAEASVMEGRVLIDSAAGLVSKVVPWVRARAEDDSHEVLSLSLTERGTLCRKVLLASFLDAVLEACGDKIGSSLAHRTFEATARVVRSGVRSDWEEGRDVMLRAIDASNALGRSFDSLQSRPTIASLILIAHTPLPTQPDVALLTAMFPVVISSLQTNTALDETLHLLLTLLSRSSDTSTDIPPDILLPLTALLPPICSVHPDPSTRYLTFRLLANALHMAQPPIRLQVLRTLLSPSETVFPQMRTAAVTLVKESVLRALANPTASAPQDVFARPELLEAVGSFVFRTDPPGLFDGEDGVALAEFVGSSEPARLVECLGFYLVLLKRDVENKTGVRDLDFISGIERSFLSPMRSRVASWLDTLGGEWGFFFFFFFFFFSCVGKGVWTLSVFCFLSYWLSRAIPLIAATDDLHDIMPLAALQMNIQLVDAAVREIVPA